MEKNELIKQIDGNQVMDSRDVAKMIGKRHRDLMRDIRRYINDMATSAKLRALDFFIESTYEDAKGETRECYLLTKQGCEFVGKSWVLYQKYADQGYAQYEPFAYDGNKGVHNNLKWTQKGKKFIYDLLKEYNVHPVLERMDLLEG